MPTVNERVAAGAALLDEKRPGWERKIDLTSLLLADSCRCVLGQLYGNYYDGVDIIGVTGDHVGFSVYPDEHMTAYGELDEAWVSLIKERFDTGA